jgi:hypothetical protein
LVAFAKALVVLQHLGPDVLQLLAQHGGRIPVIAAVAEKNLHRLGHPGTPQALPMIDTILTGRRQRGLVDPSENAAGARSLRGAAAVLNVTP